MRRAVERALYDLFVGDAADGVIFETLSGLTGAKYPPYHEWGIQQGLGPKD